MKTETINNLKEKLQKCKDTSLKDIKLEDVDDLSTIKISRKKSSNERILDFLLSVKNPYVFKVDNHLVKIGFSNNNVKAEDCISNVISSIYK